MIKRSKYVEFTVSAIMVVICLVAILLTSCKTLVPVVEYHDRYVTDTLLRIDSTYIDRWHTIREVGDTVYIHDSIVDWRFKEVYKDKEVYVHDSVPYPVEVIKPVRTPNAWDKFCHWVTIIVIVALLLFVAYKLIKLYLRR